MIRDNNDYKIKALIVAKFLSNCSSLEEAIKQFIAEGKILLFESVQKEATKTCGTIALTGSTYWDEKHPNDFHISIQPLYCKEVVFNTITFVLVGEEMNTTLNRLGDNAYYGIKVHVEVY